MKFVRNLLLGCVVFVSVFSSGSARTLRLFVIGNSFSINATRHLPQLALAGGHELVIGRAETGGCSFERHWNALEADLANPGDAKGKIYRGKSLRECLGGDAWDIVTLQQYSMHSSDIATYRPYAPKLHAHLRAVQPAAEIVIHQTWAYRPDATRFGQTGPNQHASSNREMWEKSRAAYREIASELGCRLIPVGDAFWRVDSDPRWGYKPDTTYDPKKARWPDLPDQNTSLHSGYRWTDARILRLDANHAGVAGEYLGALVWYAFLFEESPEALAYVPAGIAPEFAAHLRRVAGQTVRDLQDVNEKMRSSRRVTGSRPRPSP